jgi:SAM-dependent methyltransferase
MESLMPKSWTADEILLMSRSYQPACILAAAADLDLFRCLEGRDRSAGEIARSLVTDLRATTLLLDALAALEILDKMGDRYSVPPTLLPLLSSEEPGSVLAMARHQANCLRRWARLTRVVVSGKPPEREPGPGGPEADTQSFIGAMHDISAPVAREVIRALEGIPGSRLLDVGGASGTWTLALLEGRPGASAVLFDLPEVIPLARSRLGAAGMIDRVLLVAGDFLRDPLPAGSDLAWISAIIHQNSREQNRILFASVLRALTPGGHIALRDVVMEPSRTSPAAGALFALNMLVSTEGGGTYTLDEIREDLEASGFSGVAQVRRDPAMNSLVVARKPDADR